MATPILWAQRGNIGAFRPAKKWIDGKLVPVTDELGRPLMERLPQAGRVGVVRQVEDIEATKPQRQPRFLSFMKDGTKGGGATVFCPITGAAAAEPGTDKSFELDIRAKAKRNGWIQVGRCPIDVAMSGDILGRGRMLEAPENREAYARSERCDPGTLGPSKPPCKHWVAEEAARKATRVKDNAKIGKKKSAAEKAAERQAEAFEKLANKWSESDEVPSKPARKGKQESGE